MTQKDLSRLAEDEWFVLSRIGGDFSRFSRWIVTGPYSSRVRAEKLADKINEDSRNGLGMRHEVRVVHSVFTS